MMFISNQEINLHTSDCSKRNRYEIGKNLKIMVKTLISSPTYELLVHCTTD